MEKPPINIDEIVRNVADDRAFQYNIEVSKTRRLLEAIENHAKDNDKLDKHLQFGKHLMQLAEGGAITPEIISQMRSELYEECLKTLNL